MAFIDEVEELEAKARLRKAAPIAGAGIAVLVLVVAVFALSGVFGGAGDFAVTASEGGTQRAGASTGSSATNTEGAGSSGSAAGAASSQGSSNGTVVVYVTGAVCKPGVYSFDGGARVKDAIDAAGGFSKKADASSLNLARALADGEQIEVLTRSQARKAQAAGTGTGGASASAGAASSHAASGGSVAGSSASGKVNINTATAEELKTLNGVGDVTAQKIIDYRESSGPFAKPEDLKNVSGIGDKRYEAIAASICV